MAPRQPMLRDQMPDMNPAPRMTIATPEAEQAEYRRQMMVLQDAARFKGLLGNPPDPYARGLRPPTDAERARLDVTNPEMPLNDLARARLEAERPFNPGSTTLYTPRPPDNPNYYTGGTPDYSISSPRAPSETMAKYYQRTPDASLPPYPVSPPSLINPLPPDFMDEARRNAMADYYQRMGINPGRPMDGTPPSFSPNTRYNPDGTLIPPVGVEMAADPEPEEYDGFVDSGTGRRGYLDFKYMPTPLPPIGGEVATAPEPEEYDGFVDSGTGQRGYLDFKYMPTPMDQAAPVAMASTAYNAPPVANTAYMPPPTDAPVNTAYNAPPVANTAYMPSRRTVPVDTTYRPPAQANTTYMPSSAPTYGMSSTPSYGMSNAQTTTPTYTGPSFSPNQAGKYKVDGPRLKNTGGLFNDLNAFFGRPQT